MDQQITDYGNWVSRRLIVISAAVGALFLGLASVFPVLGIFAAAFLLVSAYFLYARYRFSPRGGNVQERIQDLLLDHLDWDGQGQALDIGCGSGALTIQLAKMHPSARITGIDDWGEAWEYSQSLCEQNAKIEGVSERVAFQKAGADALPFPNGSYDAVVSNLVFHEVKGVADKRELIREALRVVKKGGKFAFQDLFFLERIYGKPEDLVETIKEWGIQNVEFIATREAPFIPIALKLPFMVGTIAVVAGEK